MNAIRIFTHEDMKREYGTLYEGRTLRRLRRRYVPRELWPLIPYAEFWWSDDTADDRAFMNSAPLAALENLALVGAQYEELIFRWAGLVNRPPSFRESRALWLLHFAVDDAKCLVRRRTESDDSDESRE